MPGETVSLFASGIEVILTMAWFSVALLQPVAIPGSSARNTLSTWGIILSVPMIATYISKDMQVLAAHDYVAAMIYTACITVFVYVFSRMATDDNWFTTQFSRMRDEIKKLRNRIGSLGPPVPIPA